MNRFTLPSSSQPLAILLAGILIVGCCTASALAEPDVRYVSDLLVVRLRSSMEQPYTTVATVQTGDRLVVVEERTDGYVKVRTDDNREGWIAAQYLSSATPKSTVIETLRQRIAELERGREQSSLQPDEALSATRPDPVAMEALSSENEMLKQRNDELESRLAELNARIEAMGRPGAPPEFDPDQQHLSPATGDDVFTDLSHERDELVRQRDALIHQNVELAKRLEEAPELSDGRLQKLIDSLTVENKALTAELEELKRDRTFYWFLTGAAVFFAGIIFGGLSFRKKRRLSY